MTAQNSAAIVLAAGLGTRMKSALPKVLHPVAGRAMVLHLLDRLGELKFDRKVVVIGRDTKAVTDAVSPIPTAI